MRSVWPRRIAWLQGARAGTTSSWITAPVRPVMAGSWLIATSPAKMVFDVQEGAQALRRRIADRIVLGRDRTAPGRRAHRGHGVVGPRVEHVGAVSQDHDQIHLGPQRELAAWR